VYGDLKVLLTSLTALVGSEAGGVLSPTLFSFFIKELALDVAKNGWYRVQLTPDIIQIWIMLFADDVILTSYYIKGFQTLINLLKQYADNFSMTVNMQKTKIIVFRKGGSLSVYTDLNRPKWLAFFWSTSLEKAHHTDPDDCMKLIMWNHRTRKNKIDIKKYIIKSKSTRTHFENCTQNEQPQK